MSGDSAGGNLVASMQIYMLQNKLVDFMADHLLLVYAAPHYGKTTLSNFCISFYIINGIPPHFTLATLYSWFPALQ